MEKQKLNKQDSGMIQLHYSLTRIQRLLNPPDNLILQIFGAVVIIVFISSAIITTICNEMTMPIFALWMLTLIASLFFGSMLKRHIIAFELLEGNTNGCLVFSAHEIGFGRDKPEYCVSREHLKVCKGLAGTLIIRIKSPMGYVILVPEKAISYSELKKLVEVNRSNN